MMNFRPRILNIRDLLLHPNNYRFIDNPDFRRRLATRFHSDAVQEATLRLLERGHRYQLKALRNSILANGYVPIERIIVIPYERAAGKYLVVEGNRRVAALRTILRDAREGVVSITPEQQKLFSKIPSTILEAGDMTIQEAERVIMGIRHIAGPREWGAYQQAQLIYELIREQGQDFINVADHLGLSRVEVGRRYRAIVALKSMENDEEYAEEAKPEFYRLFHELVSTPIVREFFGWDHNKTNFEDENKAREFYDLIAPQEPDKDPKIRTYSDVRKLKLIIGNKEAEASLLDPDQTLNDALKYSKLEDKDETSLQLSDKLVEFERVLIDVGLDELRGLAEDDIEKLEGVIELIQQRIEDYKKLQP